LKFVKLYEGLQIHSLKAFIFCGVVDPWNQTVKPAVSIYLQRIYIVNFTYLQLVFVFQNREG